MSYSTYTTDAIVCGTYNRNTADRSYRLYTKTLGMIWADARSVRQEKSKQRQALTDFSLVRVSLVRSRVGWRIGSVISHANFYHAATDQLARGSVVTLVRLLRRYMQGEQSDDELFSYVISALYTLSGSLEKREFVEQLVTLAVLSSLGYVACTDQQKKLTQLPPKQLADQFDTDLQVGVVQQLATAESASQL